MSSIVTVFDPSTSQATSFTAPSGAANGALVFFNESNISLDLNFADGSSMYLPAWYHRHKCGATGSVNIAWDVHQVLSSSAPPISEIIVEAFNQGDAFPADGPLVRQANVGNVITTAGSGSVTTSIINDGNPAGTVIVESTVNGDSSSAVKITNDSQVLFGSATNPGSLTAMGPSILANILKVIFSGGVALQALDGADIIFQSPANNEVGRIVNDGTFKAGNGGTGNVQAASIILTIGSLTRIAVISNIAITTASANYAHGLGVIPDFVICQPNGGVSTSRTVNVNFATLSNTTFNATGNGTFTAWALAIKL